MKYDIKNLKNSNVQEVDISNSDYIASGGQGSVYGKNNKIFKIYHDKKDMIPTTKINELSVLEKDNIISPVDIIYKNKCEVGYTMKWVKDGNALCKLFTNDFWNRCNIDFNIINSLVLSMIDTISYIHSKNILLVDGNEMNYIVDDKFKIPYFIDVDSYQTKNYPATVIMPSIRDWNSKTFSELTDWFSFAIVAFRLYTGIHPFCGSHPNYKRNDMENRIKNNISVFNKDVSVPSVTRDFSNIPNNFKQWFIDLFDKGLRELPPNKVVKTIQAAKVFAKTISKDVLIFKELIASNNAILKFKNDVMFTEKTVTYNKLSRKNKKNLDVLFVDNEPIFVCIEGNKLELTDIKENEIQNLFRCEDKTIVDGDLYILNEGKIMNISFEKFNNKLLVCTKGNLEVMPNSTKTFNGFFTQDLLGVFCLTIPYRNENKAVCFNLKIIPELNGSKVLEGKYEKRVLKILTYDGTGYNIVTFKFSKDFSSYTHYVTKVSDYIIPNFTVLDNGIIVQINEEDEMLVEHVNGNGIKVVKDKNINFNMRLCSEGNSVQLISGNKVYNIILK